MAPTKLTEAGSSMLTPLTLGVQEAHSCESCSTCLNDSPKMTQSGA